MNKSIELNQTEIAIISGAFPKKIAELLGGYCGAIIGYSIHRALVRLDIHNYVCKQQIKPTGLRAIYIPPIYTACIYIGISIGHYLHNK